MPRSGAGRVAFFLAVFGVLFLALQLRAYQLRQVREVGAIALGTVAPDVRQSTPIAPEHRSNRDFTGSSTATPAAALTQPPPPTAMQSPAQAPKPGSPLFTPRSAEPQPSTAPRGAEPPPSTATSHDSTPAASPSPPNAHPELPAGVPYASNTDPVRIESIELSSKVVRAGDVASARVITTSNAAALTARIASYQINVPKVAPGMFALTMALPRMPLPNRSVDIIVTAIRSDGATAQRKISVNVYL